MGRKPVQTRSHTIFRDFLACTQQTGVRKQILFTCGTLMVIMILTGLMLGTISYETMQDYHTSTQTVSNIYTLNDALDEWEVALEDYVLNTTDISRQICLDRWKKIGTLLDDFYVSNQESAQLALDNLQAVYTYTGAEMERLLTATENVDRTVSYTTLVQQKEGLIFLTDQLLRLHTSNAVENYPDVISANLLSLGIFLLILICATILLVMCSRQLIRSVCTPIDLLVEGAKKVAGGQYDTPDVAVISDDEMGYLSQVFNNMKAQVSANFKNMERIIELQELLQSTELKALQSQINPHFLFNVLSVAEESALYESADATVEIIENISYMLQYSLKCTKQDTTLQEELRMVKAYLFLQEKRFGDRIRFEIFVPEKIPQLLIPGMSLQPVVENAILHGLENMESGGVIQVRVQEKAPYIEVTVSDNGCGIEPTLLSAIQHGEAVSSKEGGGGIGLINVSRRMHIFYKQNELFEISSQSGHGTTVVLRYPNRESKVEHVQAASC